MLHTHLLQYFETENGPMLMRAKKFGEHIVPMGCHYDDGDVLHMVERKLKEDLYPLLFFLDAEICRHFELGVESISYSACLKPTNANTHRLDNIESICQECLYRLGPQDFELYIDIELTKNSCPVGTQVRAGVDKITYQDEDATEDFPVWTFTIAGVETTVDELYSNEKLPEIIKNILEELDRRYLIESGQWKWPGS